MKKGIAIGAAVFLVFLSGLIYWLGRDGDKAVSSGVVSVAVADGAAGGGASTPVAAPTSFKTGLESLPASLRGTEVDGEFEVDAQGHLKITNQIRHIFDYFLSTVGEEPVDTVVKRIHAYIHSKLKDPAAGEADHILDGYIAYKRALTDIQPVQPLPGGKIDIDAARRQMDQVAALRLQYLSPEVIQAFFGDEDAYNRYTLARLQIINNKSLSAAQRAQQLAALEQQLPASLQASMKTVNQYQDLQSETADCKQRGCSPAELRQVRETLVGPEAADRLEALDKQNAAWGQRMDSWYVQRDAIMNNPGMSDSDKQEQVAQLRSTLFNEQEQVRVQALERIHDSGQKVN